MCAVIGDEIDLDLLSETGKIQDLKVMLAMLAMLATGCQPVISPSNDVLIQFANSFHV